VSFAAGHEVPQISTRKTRLRPSEFLMPSAKRLLQHYHVTIRISSAPESAMHHRIVAPNRNTSLVISAPRDAEKAQAPIGGAWAFFRSCRVGHAGAYDSRQKIRRGSRGSYFSRSGPPVSLLSNSGSRLIATASRRASSFLKLKSRFARGVAEIVGLHNFRPHVFAPSHSSRGGWSQ